MCIYELDLYFANWKRTETMSLLIYFAYDPDEYYASLQMGLPALYYSGRENPPHPEIWINYFLKMMELYSKKVYEFTPIEVSKMIGVTNKTVINRCAKLSNNGFLIPIIVKTRVRSYRLTDFSRINEKRILKKSKVYMWGERN